MWTNIVHTCVDSAAEGLGPRSSLQEDNKNTLNAKCFQVWGLFRVYMNFRFKSSQKHLILGYVRKPLILGSEVGVPLYLGASYTWVITVNIKSLRRLPALITS